MQILQILLLLLSCKTEKPSAPEWASAALWEQWTACAEPSCRSAVLATQFSQDAMLVANWINVIEQPEEQLLQISRLQTENPGRVQVICESLMLQQVRQKCQTSAARPHLYAQGSIPKMQQIPKRKAPGPEASLVLLPMVHNSPLVAVEANSQECEGDVDPRSCLQRKAIDAAQQGDSLRAAQYCQAIPNQQVRWRWECHFKVAETFISNDPFQYETAAAHCLVAQEYSGRCVVALHHRIAQNTPAADAAAEEWSELQKIADKIAKHWKEQQYKQSLQDELLGSFWGVVLLKAYQKADTLTGAPLDHLSENAHPHVYAAAAYVFLQKSTEARSLDELVLELETLLQNRVTQKKGRSQQPPVLSIGDYWMQDEPQDIDIPAVGYLGKSRRTFSKDPKVDLAICILEAAARQGGIWGEILQQQHNAQNALVRWTTKRLLDRRR